MAAYWPHHDDNPFARHFNSIPKYVASRGRPDLSWAGSAQLGPDLAGAVPTNLTLLEPPVAAPNGIVYLRYGLAEGIPATGDMSAPG